MKIAIIYSNRLLATQLGVLLQDYKPILISQDDDKSIDGVTLQIIINDKKLIITNKNANFSHYYDIPFEEGRILQDVREQKILCDEIDELDIKNKLLQSQIQHLLLIDSHTKLAQKNAMEIQKNLMPNSNFKYKNLSVYASVLPAEMLAGDFYYYEMLNDNKFLFLIGDVSNKNIDAAMYMTKLITSIKSLTIRFRSHNTCLENLINEVNEVAKQDNNSNQFCTMFAGIISLKENKLSYINAGHEPPYILISKGKNIKLESIKSEIIYAPLGIYQDAYKPTIIDLPKNDYKLYLYTDGITDAASANVGYKNLKRYNAENLEKVLLRCKNNISAEQMCKLIEKDILSFKHGAMQNDDITQICIDKRG